MKHFYKIILGIQLKIEKNLGWHRDDSALNAIRLTCSDGEELITNNEGEFGTWWPKLHSKNKIGISGVALRSEKPGGDDTAGNGIRFKDQDGKIYSPGDGHFGKWSSGFCPNGTIVTGFRTKVEPKTHGDNTALNDVDFICSKNCTFVLTANIPHVPIMGY